MGKPTRKNSPPHSAVVDKSKCKFRSFDRPVEFINSALKRAGKGRPVPAKEAEVSDVSEASEASEGSSGYRSPSHYKEEIKIVPGPVRGKNLYYLASCKSYSFELHRPNDLTNYFVSKLRTKGNPYSVLIWQLLNRFLS